jgi:hypothetical protein
MEVWHNMTQIKLRRDTSANFASKNPVLGIGEPAYETDTKKLKIGDGTTAYNDLVYLAGGSSTFEVVQPLKLVDGTLTLQIDEQTIQVQDGKLVANLDELGNEVNTLAGEVSSVQADLLKKQDGLVSASPIEIKKSTGLTVVGTPMSGSDFVMDSISTTSYCLVSEDYLAIGNEYQIKFTTPSSWPSAFASIVDFYDPLGPQYDYETGNISVWTNRDGAGFEPVIPSPALNTTYYIRMKMITSTRIETCYSTDGKAFTEWKATDINANLPWSAQRHHVGVGYDPRTSEVVRVWTGTIDLKECYVIANGVKYYMFPDAKTGAIGINLGSGLTVTDGKLTTTGGGGTSTVEKHGLEGDYCSKYGIVDCPNGILSKGNGQVTLKAGVVMQMTETDGLTTNASDMPHDITSTVDFDLFYTSGSLLEATQVVFSEQEPDNGTTDTIAWYNGMKWQFKSNNEGNVWRAAPAVRLAHFHVTDGNITRIDYIGNRQLNKLIPVTTDTEQTITGQKTFTDSLFFDCTKNIYGDLGFRAKYQTGSQINTEVVFGGQLGANNNLSFGLDNALLQIMGNPIQFTNIPILLFDGKKFLTQSNVTAGDNITVTETVDGVQVVGLSNAAITSLIGITNNITVQTDFASGTEFTPTETMFWLARGETNGAGYISIDIKGTDGSWTIISGLNAPTAGVYLCSPSLLINAGETFRVRYGSIRAIELLSLKPKGGVQ